MTTLRLFHDYSTTILLEKLRLLATTIPEAVTTIPARALRLLLTSIGYRAKARKEIRRQPSIVPRRPPRSCRWTARRVECTKLTGARLQASGRGKHRDAARLTLARLTVETLDPPGWHGLRYAALSGVDL